MNRTFGICSFLLALLVSFLSVTEVVFADEPAGGWIETTDEAEWSARSGFPYLFFDDKQWVLGGEGGSGSANDVWRSVGGEEWTLATSSAEWIARSNPQGLVFDDKLWMMGGNNAGNLNDVWYSEDGVTWTQATSSAEWAGRSSFASAVFAERMWVLGGTDTSGDRLNDVWYSEDGVTWTEATGDTEWEARSGLSALSDGDILFIAGGTDGSSSLGDVWYASYTLSFDTQGGSSVAAIPEKLYGLTATVPAAPTRSGYSFVEWNASPDGSGEGFAPGDSYVMGSNNATLYAIWQADAQEEEKSHRSGGTSIRSQVRNLEEAGNTAKAEALKAKWAQLFGGAASEQNTTVRDLELGMTGTDVLQLQKVLNSNGYTLAKSGLGAPGSETEYFGALTRAALARFQAENGVAPAAGYFGPITRAKIKDLGLGGVWW